MISTKLTSAAANLARRAHAGRIDRTGAPEIDHYLRLADGMDSEDAACAALLCDALGDGGVSEADLRGIGLPEETVAAILLLTHEEPEDYFDYVLRVKEDGLAAKVRRAELALRVEEMDSYVSLTGMDRRRRTTCRKAMDLLDGTDELWFDGTFASQHGAHPAGPTPPSAPVPPAREGR